VVLFVGAFSALTIYISYLDFYWHIISDRINRLALAVVALASGYLLISEQAYRSIVIAWLVGLIVFLIFYILALVSRGSLGGGDVKFAPSIAVFLALFDPWWGFLAPLIAFQLAAMAALVLLIFKKRKLTQSIAFAPFLAAGFHLVLISKLVVA
jgi:leader peptidase (prepilin peptidase) / N-methyltransferase